MPHDVLARALDPNTLELEVIISKYKPTENETSTHILLEINSQKNAFISKLNCHWVYKKREPKQWWACS